MTRYESATLIYLCLAQMVFILHAAGLVLGIVLFERADPYEPRHRADVRGLSTWQSHGRALVANITVDDPADLDERRAAVDVLAAIIEARAEIWNRDLLTGPLFEYEPVPERYEGSAGDPAYLELGQASLARAAQRPARPHPARVDTSELTVIDLGEESELFVGVT